MVDQAVVERSPQTARHPKVFPNRLMLVGLLLSALAVYLLGDNRMPLLDRDEPWYAQVSRHMVQSGDWVVPQFRDQIFEGKPVFAFWCQALSMLAFGQNPFAARFPSAVAGVLTLAVVGWGVSRFVGARRALWSVLILSTSAIHVALSKMALVDSELLLWITIAQLCLAMIYGGRSSWPVVATFWVSTGLALLTKGPVVLGIFGGTVIALAIMDVGKNVLSPRAWLEATRWWWKAQPWAALLIIPGVIGPWLILVGHRAPGFLHDTLRTFMWGPIVDKPLNSRPAMPGFYLAMIWPAFLPWSLLLPAAIVKGWKNRRLRAIRFALAAVVGPLVVIEIVKQKLPHYLLPLLPPLAFLTADVIVRCVRGQYKIARPASWKWGVMIWAAALTLLAAAPWVAALPQLHFVGLPLAAMGALTVTGMILVCVSGALLLKNRLQAGFISMGVGSMLLAVIIGVLLMPGFTPLRASQLAADAMWKDGFSPGDQVALIGYTEPSLTFYLDGAGAVYPADYLTANDVSMWPKWIVMSGGKYYALLPGQKKLLQEVGTFRSASTGSSKGSGEIVVLRKARL